MYGVSRANTEEVREAFKPSEHSCSVMSTIPEHVFAEPLLQKKKISIKSFALELLTYFG